MIRRGFYFLFFLKGYRRHSVVGKANRELGALEGVQVRVLFAGIESIEQFFRNWKDGLKRKGET